MRLLHMLIRK